MPDGVAQVGCVVLNTVGTVGAVGTALIVTVLAALVIHVLSVVLLTLNVFTPDANPLKVAETWYTPFTPYSTPAWVLNTIVPDGTAQVGCVVLNTVGTVGAVGTALIVTVEAALVIQVLSVVLLTLNVFTPGVNPLKVAET